MGNRETLLFLFGIAPGMGVFSRTVVGSVAGMTENTNFWVN